MSKLLSAVVVAGLALGMSAAVAQNVDSDKDKAKGQEQIMQDKGGAGQSQPSQTQSQQSPSGETQGASATKGNDGQTQAGQPPMRSRQYSQMRERCGTFTGDQREQCLSNARSRYLTSATARCERLTDASMKQNCFNDIQGAVGLPTTGQVTGSTDAASAGTQDNQGETVKRGGDEDKPGRQ